MTGTFHEHGVMLGENHRAECEQVDRILQSGTFRHSEALRRLLVYLAENSLLGRADDLKEYSVGMDAFSKPASYDPRRDSSVRLQVGRLRQKLAEYYRTEGLNDPLRVDLPKRHFKVVFEPQSFPALVDETVENLEARPVVPESARSSAREERRDRLPVVLGAALVMSIVIAGSLAVRVWQDRTTKTSEEGVWTTELRSLWDPFIDSHRPIIVSVADPLFVRFGRSLIVRDPATESWDDVLSSGRLMAVKGAVKANQMLPSFGYAPFGDLDGTFMLARLLTIRKPDISLAQSTQLSARQLGDNNFILLGSHLFFDSVFRGVPVDTRFRSDSAGIHDLRSQNGQPVIYSDHTEFMANGLSKGTAYAVVINLPGPFGKGEVRGFLANSPSACLGAVRCFTDAGLARALVSRMTDAHGALPRYYEAVLKVSFENSMPVQISYVTHRELLAAGNLVSNH